MSFLETAWHKKAKWLILLWPLSLLFRILVAVRRKLNQRSSPPAYQNVALIVIGNISVGGTGKTPLLICLAQHFTELGFKPGIISRGYGGQATAYPMDVDANSDVSQSGDEALLIAEKTACPVVVDPDRNRALQHLLDSYEVDLVLSDDGLQHYKLYRDIEIAVVDAERLFGNGFCLPAGPLREPISRLLQVDHIVINGKVGEANEVKSPLPAQLSAASRLQLDPRYLINLSTGEKRPFSGAPFNMGTTVQAISGLGNPQRFYELLARLPYRLEVFSFPDHHAFTPSDLERRGIDAQQPVVMTEKDAVKCREFAQGNYWMLSVDVQLEQEFLDKLTAQVKELSTSSR